MLPPSLPPELVARHAHASAVVGRRVVSFGGIGPKRAGARATAMWEAGAAAWQRVAEPDAGPVSFAAACARGGELVVCGGTSRAEPRVARTAFLDPVIPGHAPGGARGRWRAGPDLAEARSRHVLIALGRDLFALGGYGDKANVAGAERLDVATPDRWRATASPPLAVHGHAAVAREGVVALFGGYGESAGDWGQRRDVQVFDAREERWRRGEPLPSPRGFFGAALVEGRAYVFGGRARAGERQATLACDELGGPWREVGEPLPWPRCRYSTVVLRVGVDVDGAAEGAFRIVLLGGEGEGEEERPVVFFDPERGTWGSHPAAAAGER